MSHENNDTPHLNEILRMHDDGCPHHDDEHTHDDVNMCGQYTSMDRDNHNYDGYDEGTRGDYEDFQDSILEQQELLDFEQVDEYYTLDFGYQDYPDYGDY